MYVYKTDQILSFQALQTKCKEYQQKGDLKKNSGFSWQPTKIPRHLLIEFPSELHPHHGDDETDSDWLVENHFGVLAKQMTKLQEQLDKREDNLEKNEETVLIFKGLANDLLNWLEQQLALIVIKKLPDANREQLEQDIDTVQVCLCMFVVFVFSKYRTDLIQDASILFLMLN